MSRELFDKQPPMRKTFSNTTETITTFFDDYRSFGWLRNDRDRAVMLEIRLANGDITASAYSLLESVHFNPSQGITLNFSGTIVTLIGRNLNAETRPNVRLFEGLTRHRVLWIQESDRTASDEASETGVVIDAVSLNIARQ